MPIPCVNELDHALPDTIRYSTQREPTEGVNLNLDPNFLCSCDCEDDCQVVIYIYLYKAIYIIYVSLTLIIFSGKICLCRIKQNVNVGN